MNEGGFFLVVLIIALVFFSVIFPWNNCEIPIVVDAVYYGDTSIDVSESHNSFNVRLNRDIGEWRVINHDEFLSWLSLIEDSERENLNSVLMIPAEVGRIKFQIEGMLRKGVFGYFSSEKCKKVTDPTISLRVEIDSNEDWEINTTHGSIAEYVEITHEEGGSFLKWTVPTEVFVSQWQHGLSYGKIANTPDDIGTYDWSILENTSQFEIISYGFPISDLLGRGVLLPVLEHAVLINTSVHEYIVVPSISGITVDESVIEGGISGGGIFFFGTGGGMVSGSFSGWTTTVYQGNIFIPKP